MQGWDVVHDVLQGYKHILPQAPRRIEDKDRQLRRADDHSGLAHSKHRFIVHLLVIDIIATGSAGAYNPRCDAPSCYLLL